MLSWENTLAGGIPSDRRDAWKPEARDPEPFVRVTARPTADQWRRQSAHEYRMTEALYEQEFRNIKIAYDGSHRLTISLANERLHPISRAVGRAVRTALGLAPVETREIRITFAERTDPVVTYDFFDLGRLRFRSFLRIKSASPESHAAGRRQYQNNNEEKKTSGSFVIASSPPESVADPRQ